MLWCSRSFAWAFCCVALLSALPYARSASCTPNVFTGVLRVTAGTSCTLDGTAVHNLNGVTIDAGGSVTVTGAMSLTCNGDFTVNGDWTMQSSHFQLSTVTFSQGAGSTIRVPKGIDVEATSVVSISGSMFHTDPTGVISLYSPTNLGIYGTVESTTTVLLTTTGLLTIGGHITAPIVRVDTHGAASFVMQSISKIDATNVTVVGDSGSNLAGQITANYLEITSTNCIVGVTGKINVASDFIISSTGNIENARLSVQGPQAWLSASLLTVNNNSPTLKSFGIVADGTKLDFATKFFLNNHAFSINITGLFRSAGFRVSSDSSVLLDATGGVQIDGLLRVAANTLTVLTPNKLTAENAILTIVTLVSLHPGISINNSIDATFVNAVTWTGAWNAKIMIINFEDGVMFDTSGLVVTGGDVTINALAKPLTFNGTDNNWQCNTLTVNSMALAIDSNVEISIPGVKVISAVDLALAGIWTTPYLIIDVTGSANLHGNVSVGSLMVLASGDIYRYDSFTSTGSSFYNASGAITFNSASTTKASDLYITSTSSNDWVGGGGIFESNSLTIITPGAFSVTVTGSVFSVAGDATITASSVSFPGVAGASNVQVTATSGDVSLSEFSSAATINVLAWNSFNGNGQITAGTLTATASIINLYNTRVTALGTVDLIALDANPIYLNYMNANMVSLQGGFVSLSNPEGGTQIQTLVANANELLLEGGTSSAMFINNVTAITKDATTIGNRIIANTVFINSSGAITLNPDSMLSAEITTVECQNFELASNATIYADARSQLGPGSGSENGTYISGAGHGGSGGKVTPTTTGSAYDSFITPSLPGSQGGYRLPGIVTLGGGVISIKALNCANVSGVISASGASTTMSLAAGASGGSILVETGNLQGDGKFIANGGNGSMALNFITGGGGGGRIALKSAIWSFTGKYEAYGGYTFDGTMDGGAGTIYMEISGEGELRVDNGRQTINQSNNLLDGTPKRGATYLIDKTNTSISLTQVYLQGAADLVVDTGITPQLTIGSLMGDLTGTMHVPPCSAVAINSFACSVDPPESPMGFNPMCSSFSSYSYSLSDLPDYLAVSSFLNINGTVCGLNPPHIVEAGGHYSPYSGAVFLGSSCDQYQLPYECGGLAPVSTTTTTTTTTVSTITTTTSYSAASSTTAAAATTTSSGTTTATTAGSSTAQSSTTTTGNPTSFFDAPTNITTNSTRRSITIQWEPVIREEYVYYTVDLSVQSTPTRNSRAVSDWVNQYNGSAPAANISNLPPNTVSNFRLQAITLTSSSYYAYFSATTKQLDKPSLSIAPSYVKYNRTAITVKVFYPYDDGGLPILNYTLQMQNGTTWLNYTITPPAYSIEITNLKIGTTYSFKSSSTNELGDSPFSAIGDITTSSVSCGDGICDANESCKTCFLDCGSCGSTCVANCNGHGSCNEGICTCTSEWYGPLCDLPAPPPVIVVVNNTTPVVNVGINGSGIDFRIFFDSIKEIKLDGSFYDPYPLNLTDFKFISQNVTYNNTGVTYRYSNTLSNKAVVTVFISTFKNATSIVFANKTIHIPQNGIKFAMNVSNWPFSSAANKLQIKIRSDVHAPPGVCKSTQFNYDASNNLKWIEQSYNGQILYGTLEDSAIVDTVNRTVQFGYEYDFITITVPHFWDFAEFDPDFQVLVDPSKSSDDCASIKGSKNNVSGKIAGGVVGAIVGAALVAGLVLFVLKKRREGFRRSLLVSSSSTELKSVNSEEADTKL